MEIENTGAARIQDIFKGITSNSGSQIANRQNERQGVSQFSLRGLGVGSTLTLLNGRRSSLFPIPDSTGQLFTDVNQYPVNMIERVEVLTDGASATYGSEALAGAVNIITRNNFEGLEFIVEERDSSHSASQLSAAFGSAFDRGHFTIFANYYEQDGNFRGDFDWIRDNLVFSSSTGSPGSYFIATTDANTGVRSFDSDTRVADADCVAAQGILNSGGNQCRYNFIDQRRLIAEEERFQMFSKLDFQIRDSVAFSAEVSHSRNTIIDGLGGAVLRTGELDGNMFIPADHPFNFWTESAGELTYQDPVDNAAAWTAGTLTATDLAAQFRPIGITGDGSNAEDIETVFTNSRVSSGFDIDVNDIWFLSLRYTWANSDYTRLEPRNYAVDKLQELLNEGRWNPFGTALVSPDLVSPKQNTDATAGNDSLVFDEFSLTKTNTGRVQQKVTDAVLSGVINDALAVAFGMQHRDLLYENFPDGLSGVLEGGRADPTSPTEGAQDAIAFFAETAWSVSDDLETQFALRYEDYDDKGGDTIDPKIAFKYDLRELFPGLALRGSWGTSFQAPSVTQVSGSVGNAGVTDPLDGVAEGETRPTFNVTVITGGSADLEPQTSTNFNLGVIYEGDTGLDFSVDYWIYDLEDLILTGASPQNLVDNCANPCPEVLRDGSGQLNLVRTSFENRGDTDLEGIDVKLAYAPQLDWPGDWIFDFSITNFLEYDSSEFGDIKNSRNFGNPFGSTPDTKMNGGVTWLHRDHALNFSARFIDSYKDDQTNSSIDSQTTFDVRYSYTFPEMFNTGDSSRITVGVVNLTDEDPPLIDNRPGLDTEVHDPRGQQVYVTLSMSL